VTVIAATGTPPTLAAKAATATIPIVFSVAVDPVKAGLVASLSRPGGNATGVAQFSDVLATKRLELLSDLVPAAKVIGFLVDPNYPDTYARLRKVEDAGRRLGSRIVVLNASDDREIDKIFMALNQQQIGGLLVDNVALFNSRRYQIVALASRHAIPAIYELRDFVAVGGLISYGANLADQYRQVGGYVGKILKGEKPGDMPVQQPTKFEMVINLQTAKALGITVPPTLLARADEVIE
jgi:putative ABC transport system substrate-binding protein